MRNGYQLVGSEDLSQLLSSPALISLPGANTEIVIAPKTNMCFILMQRMYCIADDG